jgi:hypothetical protein
MTLRVQIAHAEPGENARVVVVQNPTTGSKVMKDGDPAARFGVHADHGAVIHELLEGEQLADAENRALTRMWAAYTVQAGGQTFDGEPLPTWYELGDERQACWRAALQAI